ncbi:unnamed protein product [Natator depressus]
MNTISWLQQKPGEAPRFVLSGTPSRGDGIPDRFTGSTSGNVGYLTITSAQAEDDADYYCSVWYSSGSVTHSDRVRRGTAPKTSLPSACVWHRRSAESGLQPRQRRTSSPACVSRWALVPIPVKEGRRECGHVSGTGGEACAAFTEDRSSREDHLGKRMWSVWSWQTGCSEP